MTLISFLAFLGMVAIVTWAFLRYIKERDQEQELARHQHKGICPKHNKPWIAPDDQGTWYCGYWDEIFGAEYDYGCPQVDD